MLADLRSQAGTFLGYLRHNALRVLLDLVVVVSWMVVASAALETLNVVRWAQYVAMFVGVIAYVLVTPAWEHPDDGPE